MSWTSRGLALYLPPTLQIAAGVAALVCAARAAANHAEPKVYLVPLATIAAALVSGWWYERWRLSLAIAAGALALAVAAAATDWAYPLSAAATVRVLEQTHRAGGPTRCVIASPQPTFGRFYVCGLQRDWTRAGRFRINTEYDVKVDDSGIVTIFP